MAIFETVLKDRIKADTAIHAVVGDHVYDTNDTDASRGGVDWATDMGLVDAFGRIDPHIIVRYGTAQSIANWYAADSVEAQTIEIYIYNRHGYTAINSVVSRLKAILHQQCIESDDLGTALMTTVQVSPQLLADEYNKEPMQFVRFRAKYLR